ncbi:hypothetical protein [Corynebacterium cystitidis]|uniref:hypothetical protein n=1 Tax=Corynebacterium cystitidis TaxID=35757 RepID=UPI00211E4750|nr:hypothetical protein [Corynebacterium cystitidis]
MGNFASIVKAVAEDEFNQAPCASDFGCGVAAQNNIRKINWENSDFSELGRQARDGLPNLG